MIRTLCLAALAALLVPAYAAGDDSALTVRDAWVREAPPGVAMMAGYLVVENKGDAPRALTGARSPDFERVMIHRTVIEDDQARMVHQPRVEVPAGGERAFEPGGYHLMLMRPHQRLRAGDEVTLVLELADGATLTFPAPVRHGAPVED